MRGLTGALVAATGYHNMCRWNLFGMLQHPRIRDLQYYARMDTDSRFTEPVRAVPPDQPSLQIYPN